MTLSKQTVDRRDAVQAVQQNRIVDVLGRRRRTEIMGRKVKTACRFGGGERSQLLLSGEQFLRRTNHVCRKFGCFCAVVDCHCLDSFSCLSKVTRG